MFVSTYQGVEKSVGLKTNLICSKSYICSRDLRVVAFLQYKNSKILRIESKCLKNARIWGGKQPCNALTSTYFVRRVS